MNLFKALQQDDQPIISASCAFLTNRQSELIEVHAKDQGSAINIELIE